MEFSSRFGKLYLVKIWLFTIILGALILGLIAYFDRYGKQIIFDYGFFQYILLVIIFGVVVSIPSLIIAQYFYHFISSRKISNLSVYYLTLIFSLFVTLSTYYLFLGKQSYNSVDSGGITFSLIYSFLLSTASIIFQKKTI